MLMLHSRNPAPNKRVSTSVNAPSFFPGLRFSTALGGIVISRS
jgi:hypothetical protein